MPRRGQYAHGRDKDETVLRWYNEGWQRWWFLVVLLVLLIAGFGIGYLVGVLQHNHDEYERGYRNGFEIGRGTTTPPPSSTPTTGPGAEPDQAAPGSGAPAPSPGDTVLPLPSPPPVGQPALTG